MPQNCTCENVTIFCNFSGPELTDDKLFNLSQNIISAEDLYKLAISGLGMTLDAVGVHVTNSITIATINVLNDWRKSQPDHHVAYTNMCDALRKAERNSLIHEVLRKN